MKQHPLESERLLPMGLVDTRRRAVLVGVILALGAHAAVFGLGLAVQSTTLTRQTSFTEFANFIEEPTPPPPPPEEEPPPPPEPEPTPADRAMPAQEAAAEPLPEPTDAPANPDGGADLGAVAGGTGPAMASGNGQGGGAAPVAAAPRVAEKAAEAPPPRRARKGPVRLEDAGTPPKAVRQDPRLGYPREFREKAIAGLVVVQCIITESGKVRACRSRSGPDELATYAISVIRNWEYEPARDHAGKPVAVAFTWRFPFRLS